MVMGLSITAIVVIMACTWFLGCWNNVITFVNTLLAALVASNFFEPVADWIDAGKSSYTYLLDFVCLWLLFFATYALLRTATDMLSRHKLQFNYWVEMVGRTLFSLATAWVFLCFMHFSFHTAPFPPGAGNFQERPDSVNFVGAPDRQWLGLLKHTSGGAFPSDDAFILKYYHRRLSLSKQQALRVQR